MSSTTMMCFPAMSLERSLVIWDLTGGGGAGAIGGHGHKVHSAGQVDPAAQVRHKDEGAAQDTDEDDLLPLVVLG